MIFYSFLSETVSLSIGMNSRHQKFWSLRQLQIYPTNEVNEDGSVTYHDPKEHAKWANDTLNKYKEEGNAWIGSIYL